MNKRSIAQLRYRGGVVIPAFKEHFAKQRVFLSDKVINDIMKTATGYYVKEKVSKSGKVTLVPYHTDEYEETPEKSATAYFTDFMTNVRMFGAELGVQIPEPNEIPFNYGE